MEHYEEDTKNDSNGQGKAITRLERFIRVNNNLRKAKGLATFIQYITTQY